MYRIAYIIVIFSLLFTGCAKKIPMGEISPPKLKAKTELQKKIDEHLDSVGANAWWSVEIRQYPGGKTIYRRNPEKILIPASNVKLFTTAAALHYLGPEYRFTTTVLTDGVIDSTGVLNGNLYIVGGGDPLIGAYLDEENPLSIFSGWAVQLRESNINKVAGNLVADDSYFIPGSLEPSWEWGDLRYYYAAPAGALTFNDNCLELEIGSSADGLNFLYNWNPPLTGIHLISDLENAPEGEDSKISASWMYPDSVLYISGKLRPGDYQKVYIPVSDPSMFFMRTLSYVFEYEGPLILGELKFEESVTAADTLIIHKSPPLAEIVREINLESVNLYAEQIVRTLGKEIFGEGSAEKGLEAVTAFLDSIGIDSSEVRLVDGSGLSRHNWISAKAVVDLLEYCQKAPFADYFINSLASYGEGTLEKRMPPGVLEFNIKSKTGSMSGVRAHSGYIFKKGKWYIFSFIGNNYTGSSAEVESVLDNSILEICRD